jgi:hypothetical protein
MRSLLNTFSYLMNIFKEFYIKLLTIKICVAKLFGQPTFSPVSNGYRRCDQPLTYYVEIHSGDPE